jgi:dTDP-4-dehydrorhamnose reductase
MTVLVFGKNGQVGSALARMPGVIALDRTEADLCDPSACARIIAQTQAIGVINAAAYTAVDRAETDQSLAHLVNALAPAAMAKAAAARGLPFVQLSTDYVFDGQGSAPWSPSDMPAPLGVYGASKLAGERAVQEAGGTYAIIRTSWVFSATGGNFVKTMLRLSGEHDQLNIVSDQIGGPTSASAIAVACLKAVHKLAKNSSLSGVYHFSGGPDVSWAQFARSIFDQAGVMVKVNDIPSSDYPTPAKRPINSRLDNSDFLTRFDLERPDWRRDLRLVLADLGVI